MSDTPPTGYPAAEPVDTVPRAPQASSRTNAGTGPGAAPRPVVRRRRTRWRAAFFTLAGLALAGGVGWALLGDKVLVVRSVTVTGTHTLSPGQVIAAADVPPGTSLLSVDTGAVTRRVEALNLVASATVTEDWPDHLVIAVTERVPAMAVRMASGGYDLLDASGVIVRMTTTQPAGLPVFVTSLQGSALRGNPDVAVAGDVLAELQPWLARQVAEVSTTAVPTGPEQVTLGLRDGKTVQWGSVGNAAQKNRELSILLTGQVRDVDVSTPGTVVTSLSSPGGRPPGDPPAHGGVPPPKQKGAPPLAFIAPSPGRSPGTAPAAPSTRSVVAVAGPLLFLVTPKHGGFAPPCPATGGHQKKPGRPPRCG